jgi:hypothetical protein
VRNVQRDMRFFNLMQVMWVMNFNPKQKSN